MGHLIGRSHIANAGIYRNIDVQTWMLPGMVSLRCKVRLDKF